MVKTNKLKMCSLFLFPWEQTTTININNQVKAPKDSPYFSDLDIAIAPVNEQEIIIDEISVKVTSQIIGEDVWISECRYEVTYKKFDSSLIAIKESIHAQLRDKLKTQSGYLGDIAEEYTILLFSADLEFIEKNKFILARLVKDLSKKVNQEDAEAILQSRASYSQNDLTIIDSDGAIIFAEESDFQTDIDLIKIGNYQLLSYRMIEQTIDKSLLAIRDIISKRRKRFVLNNDEIRNIVEQQLSILLDFEKVDQSILLIGDWYSAKLYRLIAQEFFLSEWKTMISGKLENLVNIDEIVRSNIAVTWSRVLDFIQIAGWMILLIGYFILIFRDFGWI